MSEIATKVPVVFWDTEKDPYANNVKVLDVPYVRKEYFIASLPKATQDRIVSLLASDSASWQSFVRDDSSKAEMADQYITANTAAAAELGMLREYAKTFALLTAWPGENTRYVTTQESL